MKTLLSSKIYRAIVTHSDLNYEGSIGIDRDLMEMANINEYEQVHVFNVNNGERWMTYAFPIDEAGTIHVNGAAARKAVVGDRVIICTFDVLSFNPDLTHKPKIVMIGESNNDRKLKFGA